MIHRSITPRACICVWVKILALSLELIQLASHFSLSNDPSVSCASPLLSLITMTEDAGDAVLSLLCFARVRDNLFVHSLHSSLLTVS